MSGSKQLSIDLKISSPTAPIEMELLDGTLYRIAHSVGKIEQKVAPGLYLLRCTAGPKTQEQYLTLAPNTTKKTITVDLPFPSVTPITGTSTYNNRQSDAAAELSLNPYRKFGSGGRLMVFIRNIPSEEDGTIANTPIATDLFSLFDGADKMLGGETMKWELSVEEGWAGWCGDVAPGGYLLRWNSQAGKLAGADSAGIPTDQSLWVEEDWTTMVFLGQRTDWESVRRSAASVYMTQIDMGFMTGLDEFHDRISLSYEIALSGLRQGRAIVADDIVNLLLRGKFKNPMLGIIGAHAFLLKPKINWELFGLVLQNLGKLTPNHPDLAALKLIRKEMKKDFSSSEDIKPFSWPPVLYDSYRGLLTRAWREEQLIMEDSKAEYISSFLISQGPWTTWHSPVSLEKNVICTELDNFEEDAIKSLETLSSIVEVDDIHRQLRVQTSLDNVSKIFKDVGINEAVNDARKFFDAPAVRKLSENTRELFKEPSLRKIVREARKIVENPCVKDAVHEAGFSVIRGVSSQSIDNVIQILNEPDVKETVKKARDIFNEPLVKNVIEEARKFSNAPSVKRIVDYLSLLGEVEGTEPLSLKELSRKVGLPVTTVRRSVNEWLSRWSSAQVLPKPKQDLQE